MGQQPVAGLFGGRQVIGMAELAVSRREGPDDAGIEDDAARGVGQHFSGGLHLAVEAAAGVRKTQPEVQNVVFQDFGCFLQELFGFSSHLQIPGQARNDD